MPVLQVRQGRLRADSFRLRLRPSVFELAVKYGGRLLLGWRRELGVLVGLVWLRAQLVGLVGGDGAMVLLGLAAVLVLLVGRWRRAVLGWLGVGRLRRRWAAACRACGLEVGMRTPRVWRVRRTESGRRFRVQLRPGQDVTDLQRNALRLAAALGGRGLRIIPDLTHAGRADIALVSREALGDMVTVEHLDPGSGDVSGLDAVVVGRREDGGPWLLRLRGSHVLVAGASGAGKGSVLWSIVRALGPSIRSGLVEIWACDPKGGMELGFGEPLFTRFATDISAIADVLEDAVSAMNRRTGWLRGRSRLHKPTPRHPLIVVMVDEIAALTAYATDRESKTRISAALSLLLSQGRAVGVVVIGAVQDPRKDVLPFRDLFQVRVALRMRAAEVALVLGDDAYTRGAWTDRIPMSLPGVGYVLEDGDPTPVRVRAAFVDDPDIHTMAAQYGQAPAWAPAAWESLPGAAPARGLPSLGGPVPPVVQPLPARRPVDPAPPPPAPAGGWVPDVSAYQDDDPTVPLRAWTPPPPRELPPVAPPGFDDGSPAAESWEDFVRRYTDQD
ncbi:FtsK/SpoIIIE domain-containing protein [Parafrankia elaeagni]|uniref:FtsK/SpoIIIE domain-containing protein n=1 Tax=Parafrankia elaeagni TaxID=222534 RepID=UPI000377FDF4|nr:FtsK/SpoIIIE domain-containing protein [Parafrankia elaeagni]